MNNFSLIEKIQILMEIISSSPLFLFCFMLAIIILIFYVVNIKKNNKINKLFFVSMWLFLIILLTIKYNDVVVRLLDELFNYIFKILYFPDLPIYIMVLIISNIFFVISILNKKIKKSYKILNAISTIILDTILILVIDIVSKNKIDLYNSINIYSNSNLLVLLELSIAIFVSWLLLSLLIRAHYKLKKYDKIEYPKMQEIVFEEL